LESLFKTLLGKGWSSLYPNSTFWWRT